MSDFGGEGFDHDQEEEQQQQQQQQAEFNEYNDGTEVSYEEVLTTAAAAMALSNSADHEDINDDDGYADDDDNDDDDMNIGGDDEITSKLKHKHKHKHTQMLNRNIGNKGSDDHGQNNHHHHHHHHHTKRTSHRSDAGRNTNMNMNMNMNVSSSGSDSAHLNIKRNIHPHAHVHSSMTMNMNMTMNMMDMNQITEEEAELLSSLPQRPIANFPSEGDRKRVIGCLATVISMMYEYESCDAMIYKPDIANTNANGNGNGNGDANNNGTYNGETSGSGSGSADTSCHDLNVPGSSDDRGNSNIDCDVIDGDNIGYNAENDADADTDIDTDNDQDEEQYRDINDDLRNDDSFDRIWEESSPTKSLPDKDEEGYGINYSNDNKKDTIQSISTIKTGSTNTSSSASIGTTNTTSAQSTSTSHPNNDSTPSKQVHTFEMKVSIQRYKKRRHKVYSKFLVAAADYLYLDKSNAIAFLPLLNSLMDEKDNAEFGYQYTGNGIEVGPELEPEQNYDRGTMLRDWVNDASSAKSQSRPQPQPQPSLSPSQSKASSNLTSSTSSSNNSIKTPPRKVVIRVTPKKSQQSSSTMTPPPPLKGSQSQKEPQMWDDNDILIPFVESLEVGAGFQCLSLLLLNYLLQSEEGYDARIRACIKKLGVVILIHEIKQSDCEEVQRKLEWYKQRRGQTQTSNSSISSNNEKSGIGGQRQGQGREKTINDVLAEMAARKFESLEHTIATKLLRISSVQKQQASMGENGGHGGGGGSGKGIHTNAMVTKSRRDRILHGLKIGSAGVAAGALFAVTGGLAAPGIAAGLAATGLTTSAVTAGVVTTLTSTAAVTTIFGVGGGGLAAYKTHRRTKGVTEFEFMKEGKKFSGQQHENENAELFSTVCLSGWLKDTRDFQRPWGVDPTNPPITDKLERLARFYAIHKPENIPRCEEILRRWKGEERELWAVLKEKYGSSPDTLYPIYDSPYRRVVITHEEDEIVDNLLGELGYTVPSMKQEGPFRGERKAQSLDKKQMYERKVNSMVSHSNETSTSLNTSYSSATNDSEPTGPRTKKPTIAVWDYQMEYGGELLTVKWESDLLMELCDSVQDLAADLAGQAAREILKQTALATLITAVALPYALVRAANMIDGTWTLAIERADLAGIELARTLLESQAGHRPVVLIGFSMGARTVYSCLKELARQQEIWEEQQEELELEKAAKKKGKHRYRVKKKKNKDEEKILREPASIVEDAIMMGLPNHLSLPSLEACRRIVAGRLVNCYSQKDLILSLMFQFHRLSGALRPVCGTSPVRIRGVENYDVSSLISAHSDYCTMTPHILRMIYHGCPHRSQATIIVPSEFATDPAL